MKPIYDNREIVGYARNVAHAKRVLLKTIRITTGFTLQVWERPAHICDILQLPQGYVFSIGK